MRIHKHLFAGITLTTLLFAGFAVSSIAQDATTINNPDTKAPVIEATTPSGSEENVDLRSVIEITFSSEMDESTINNSNLMLHASSSDTQHESDDMGRDEQIRERSAINNSENSWEQTTGTVSGTISYSDKVAVFEPQMELKKGTTYTFTVTNGVKSSDNVALENNHEWSFTTGSSDLTDSFDREYGTHDTDTERADRERADRERSDEERADRERADNERADEERTDRERADRERAVEERSDRERTDRERADEERTDRERADRERADRERADTDSDVMDTERADRERADREHADRERADGERTDRERADRERADEERTEREHADRERADAERTDRERADRERTDEERIDRERADRDGTDRFGIDRGEYGERTTDATQSDNENMIHLGKASQYVILAASNINNESGSNITGQTGKGSDADRSNEERSDSDLERQRTTGQDEILHHDAVWISNEDRKDTTSPGDRDREADTSSTDVNEAIRDMMSAYRNASLLNGDDSARHNNERFQSNVLTPGVHEWNDELHIESDVTLSGSEDDIWVFKVSDNLTVDDNIVIKLDDGAHAENIFWYVEGEVTIGENVEFEGIILSMNNITLEKGAKLQGRMFSQASITLDDNTVTEPTTVTGRRTSINR